jgi:hypothetical protein
VSIASSSPPLRADGDGAAMNDRADFFSHHWRERASVPVARARFAHRQVLFDCHKPFFFN